MDLREIDRIVAEKVMRWKEKTLPNNDAGLPYYAQYWVNKKEKVEEPVNFFRPSWDLVNAWRVVEQLMKDGYLVTISNGETKKYSCLLYMDGIGSFEDEADTVQLAICLAALKSIGIDVEV
jgi:Phage ABA sandwich domain